MVVVGWLADLYNLVEYLVGWLVVTLVGWQSVARAVG
jgi:hypothetical protein